MKKLLFLLMLGMAVISCTDYPKIETTVPYKVVKGTIVLDTPAREPGQQSALGMTAEAIETVRIGLVGLGGRGYSALERLTYVDGIQIKAICDIYPEKVTRGNEYLASRNLSAAAEYSGEEGYKALCERDDIDLVYICTSWLAHVPVSLYALEHGKHVACEVPSMLNVKDCWDIINTSEKTRKHFMMLENCCYDFFELTTLNMAQKGLFGEVYHVEGAYIHNLNPFWEGYQDNWRLDYNSKFRGDNYPTHGVGPICQVLNIHRGDKMNYLVAMDTKPLMGAAKAKENMGIDYFADGDHTVSLIRTELGHQIEVHHNVYAPRPYSRIHQLTGTQGFANKYPASQLAFAPDFEDFVSQEKFDSLMVQYKHPITAEYEVKAREVGGHGGMDYIMDCRLIYCLRNGLPLDMDVYDAAEWCCISELSRISIEAGSMPVQVPDFTRGDWNKVQGVHHAMVTGPNNP